MDGMEAVWRGVTEHEMEPQQHALRELLLFREGA